MFASNSVIGCCVETRKNRKSKPCISSWILNRCWRWWYQWCSASVSRAGVAFTTWKRNRCFWYWCEKGSLCHARLLSGLLKRLELCFAWHVFHIRFHWRNCQRVPFEDINILNTPHSNDNPRQFIYISMLTKMFQVLKETSICVNCKCWEIYCRFAFRVYWIL